MKSTRFSEPDTLSHPDIRLPLFHTHLLLNYYERFLPDRSVDVCIGYEKDECRYDLVTDTIVLPHPYLLNSYDFARCISERVYWLGHPYYKNFALQSLQKANAAKELDSFTDYRLRQEEYMLLLAQVNFIARLNTSLYFNLAENHSNTKRIRNREGKNPQVGHKFQLNGEKGMSLEEAQYAVDLLRVANRLLYTRPDQIGQLLHVRFLSYVLSQDIRLDINEIRSLMANDRPPYDVMVYLKRVLGEEVFAQVSDAVQREINTFIHLSTIKSDD